MEFLILEPSKAAELLSALLFEVNCGDRGKLRLLAHVQRNPKCFSLEFHAVRADKLMTMTKNPQPTLEDLQELARQAAAHSYSPYSHFRVGAALRLTDGTVVTGTNVENVSYGLTICAERSALFSAVSQFGPEIRIAAVAVANLNNAASPPCGACRQVLAEFILPDAPVIFPAADGPRVLPFAELLPLAFDMKLKKG